jgi:S1-C subfamily serine protease
MATSLKRFFLALGILSLAALLFTVVRSQRPGYGLLNLLRGERPGAAGASMPKEPKLTAGDVPGLAQLDQEYAKLSAAVLPCVVSINTTTEQRRRDPWAQFFGMPGYKQHQSGEGSGAIISREGHVVTNFHVVENASKVTIRTEDGQQYEAQPLYATQEPDIAVLKIISDKKDFPALSFGNSDEVKVGQVVFAVGNPFGLSGTVTQGIISARNRRLREGDTDLLQTDAVINPGNSGGPLVNTRGEMIGINVAIYRGDTNVASWQGIGLAIPAKEARLAVDAILEHTKKHQPPLTAKERGYLGVELETRSVLISTGESRGTYGVLVTGTLPGSAAEEAGFQVEDVITAVNGTSVQSYADFTALLRQYRVGTKVVCTVWRGGKLGTVEAKLQPLPTQ